LEPPHTRKRKGHERRHKFAIHILGLLDYLCLITQIVTMLQTHSAPSATQARVLPGCPEHLTHNCSTKGNGPQEACPFQTMLSAYLWLNASVAVRKMLCALNLASVASNRVDTETLSLVGSLLAVWTQREQFGQVAIRARIQGAPLWSQKIWGSSLLLDLLHEDPMRLSDDQAWPLPLLGSGLPTALADFRNPFAHCDWAENSIVSKLAVDKREESSLIWITDAQGQRAAIYFPTSHSRLSRGALGLTRSNSSGAEQTCRLMHMAICDVARRPGASCRGTRRARILCSIRSKQNSTISARSKSERRWSNEHSRSPTRESWRLWKNLDLVTRSRIVVLQTTCHQKLSPLPFSTQTTKSLSNNAFQGLRPLCLFAASIRRMHVSHVKDCTGQLTPGCTSQSRGASRLRLAFHSAHCSSCVRQALVRMGPCVS